MALRDLVLVAVLVAALPVCVARPWIGILVWFWLGFMNPHRLTWGFAREMEFALYSAVATLVGFVLTRDRQWPPLTAPTVLMGAFWTLTAATTLFAANPGPAWEHFKQFSKVLLMNFVMLALFQDRRRLRVLLVLAALSLGFYGLKGGIWGAFVSAGQHRVWGPAGSFIEDNNALALGLNMTLPLLFFLARDEPRRWLKWLLRIVFGFTVLSVLLTYSRGGFLGLAVVLLVLMLRSRWKLVTLPAAAGAALMLVEFLPDHWFDRMNTVTTYEQDSSAMTRLWAWGIAWQIARESPLVGGGFGVFTKEVWQRFMPDYHSWHNAHSIYFQVLAEHGFTGLILFCALLLTTFATLFGVRRALRRQADAAPLRNASYAVEASLIGFVVSGAFLNLAYFDLVYFLIGIAIILRTLARREQPVAVPTEVTATTPSPVRVIAWRPS